jgi:hypothetical protein
MAPNLERKQGKEKLHSAFSSILNRSFATDSKSNSDTKQQSTHPEDRNISTPTLTSTHKTPTKVAEPFSSTTVAPSMNNMFGSKSSNAQESLITRFYDPYIRAPDTRNRTLEDILAWPDRRLESSHDYIQILFPLPEGSPYNYSAPIIDRAVMEAFRARPELRNRLRQSLVRVLDFYGFEVVSDEEFKTREQAKDLGKPAEANKEEKETHVPQTRTDAQEPEAQETVLPSDVDKTSDDTTTTPTAQPIHSSNSNPIAQPASTVPSFGGLISGFTVIRAAHFPTVSRNWAVRMDHNHLRISRILRCLRVLGLQKECEAYYSALQDVYNDPNIRIGERSMEYWTKAVKQDLWIAPDGERCNWLKRWVEEQKAKAEAEEKEKEGSEDDRVSKKAKFEATEAADTKTAEAEHKD